MLKKQVSAMICAIIFLFLTLIKMIAPAYAFEIRESMITVLDRNDDPLSWVRKEKAVVHPYDPNFAELFDTVPPLDRLRAQLAAQREDKMADLPKLDHLPEISVSEPTEDPAVSFGLAVKETFLQSQAAFSELPIPDNVSYAVFALPFSEISPVSGRSSSGFGYRMHPIDQEIRFHYGTDFAAEEGTPVLAFADGVVTDSGEDEGYGNYVKIDHGNGYQTLYGHCSEIWVASGDPVWRGEQIACVGETGLATGPHLHFELMKDGVYLNPEFYLYA